MEAWIYRPGLLCYEAALELQERFWRARCRGLIPDTLILLQHPPVITYGVGGGSQDLQVTSQRLEDIGVDVVQTNRGGRATFHGPGQLVAYPIFHLPDRDLELFSWRLEEAALQTLASFGITAAREERYPGVWMGREKLAAIGIAVREDVTTHGLAMNVSTNLAYFNLITACGIRNRGVTSMEKVLGRTLDYDTVEERFIACFSSVFGCQFSPYMALEVAMQAEEA